MSIRPNPASGNVYINYSLPRAGLVLLSVYDIRGRQVKTLVRDHKQGGEYKLIWTGDDSRGNPLPSSVYFYRLYYEGTRLTKRMVLLR
jgi:flagellar hook assembly protein FlgD